jgi:hypothetical protein
MKGGLKPLSDASRLAFNDMREHLKKERERLDRREERLGGYVGNESYVPGFAYVATPESKYLNRLLGLHKTESLMKWYKS